MAPQKVDPIDSGSQTPNPWQFTGQCPLSATYTVQIGAASGIEQATFRIRGTHLVHEATRGIIHSLLQEYEPLGFVD